MRTSGTVLVAGLQSLRCNFFICCYLRPALRWHTREEREQQFASTLDRTARREPKAAGAKHAARRLGTQRARDLLSGVSGSEVGPHE